VTNATHTWTIAQGTVHLPAIKVWRAVFMGYLPGVASREHGAAPQCMLFH
jgi:hypothetical protein